ncbi:MAG TPA: FAD-dependent monooxygenase [Steroidobacteraceae bacterium]|nr:FAD-dependent monooxygenase [Steroidobacteraceae bacterium]
MADVDILIVGAGPVGLLLANECARRGLRYRIVERRPELSIYSKALAIFPRTLEVLDMAGLIAPFLKVANRVTWVSAIAGRRRLAHIRFAPPDTPYPFVAMVPQNVTESLLEAALRERGGAVEFDTEFASADEGTEAVTASLRRDGGLEQCTAKYVVGCDGAHSSVRHLLALPFEGAQYRATFLLADVQTNESLPADALQLCPSRQGPLAIFPMSATRRRVVATVPEALGDAPSLELVQRLLTERAPPEVEVRRILWSSYFKVHHRQLSRLRVGRLFLAGDAAHVHSPFGGQGMNTGLQDVWNLAWKLDIAAQGRATDALLDSYSLERRPVIARVIELTHRMTQVLGSASLPAQLMRNVAIPVATRLPSVQRAMVRRLSQLDVSYAGSPIVDGTGARHFDDSLCGGAGIGRRLVLRLGGAVAPSPQAAALLKTFSEDLELCRQEHGVMLLRPDGYLAYSSKDPSSDAALAAVRSVLSRQITQNIT